MPTTIKTQKERLEIILESLVEGTLEIDSLKHDIDMIKIDLVARGYDIVSEYGDEDTQSGLRHLYIRRLQNA